MSGKNVLIIGGALGIGKEIVEGMVRRGERVVVVDRNVEAGQQLVNQLRAQGGEASFITADVTHWTDVENMAQHALSEMKTIDVLVYSAGITQQIPFEELTFEQWKRTISVNLTGLFYATKAIAPSMIKQRAGKIVIIGSGSAITGSGGGVHYSVSKGGAFGFMRALARELGPYGININIVAPRVIASEMLDRLYPTEAEKAKLTDVIPIGRLGTPEDVANAVYFLSTNESDYIHGQIILMDGGRTYR